MRWQGRRQSDNIEDRRGMSAGGKLAFGGGGIGLLVAIAYALFTGDTSGLIDAAQGTGSNQPYVETPIDKERKEFVAVTLADTEEVFTKLFAESRRKYTKPILVIFSGRVNSACGLASEASGPFYCPEDSKLYIDLSFYDLLKSRFGATGDFAQAYVIAHEVGHHIQNLLGKMEEIQKQRQDLSEVEYNKLSVKLELQADYYAGVWAHHAKQMAEIDEQDIQEAMEAASAIGDDAIQKQAQGYVVPDAFTHGTSEQRMRWFLKGWKSGTLSGGDTFSNKTP